MNFEIIFSKIIDKMPLYVIKRTIISVFFALLIYFFILPSTLIDYINKKNVDYSFLIIIFLISTALIFIFNFFKILYKYISVIYININNKKESEFTLNTLEFSSILLLQEFYDKKSKRFKKMAQVIFSHSGKKELEELGIIKLISAPTDEYGGYYKNKKYTFYITDKYLNVMNKMAKKNNEFMRLIKDLI